MIDVCTLSNKCFWILNLENIQTDFRHPELWFNSDDTGNQLMYAECVMSMGIYATHNPNRWYNILIFPCLLFGCKAEIIYYNTTRKYIDMLSSLMLWALALKRTRPESCGKEVEPGKIWKSFSTYMAQSVYLVKVHFNFTVYTSPKRCCINITDGNSSPRGPHDNGAI